MISRWFFFLFGFVAVAAMAEGGTRGGLVLQFDDGWSSWVTVVAPELQRVGGRATGFVNNHNIGERLTWTDLLTLQDTYGWEIGSHTYHHHNAPRFVQDHGLDEWVASELDASLSELRAQGIDARNLVFPYNASSPELAEAVTRKVGCYRRADSLALGDTIREGAVPGTAIDLTTYVPVRLLRRWVDRAARKGDYLFLYGHQVLPDDVFVTGRVASVEGDTMVVDRPIVLSNSEDLVLVPDTGRRQLRKDAIRYFEVDENTLKAPGIDLSELTREGSDFLIGPSYGTPISYFRELIEYASGRLPFLRVQDVVDACSEGGMVLENQNESTYTESAAYR